MWSSLTVYNHVKSTNPPDGVSQATCQMNGDKSDSTQWHNFITLLVNYAKRLVHWVDWEKAQCSMQHHVLLPTRMFSSVVRWYMIKWDAASGQNSRAVSGLRLGQGEPVRRHSHSQESDATVAHLSCSTTHIHLKLPTLYCILGKGQVTDRHFPVGHPSSPTPKCCQSSSCMGCCLTKKASLSTCHLIDGVEGASLGCHCCAAPQYGQRAFCINVNPYDLFVFWSLIITCMCVFASLFELQRLLSGTALLYKEPRCFGKEWMWEVFCGAALILYLDLLKSPHPLRQLCYSTQEAAFTTLSPCLLCF